MAITSLFLAPFTRTENSNGGYKRNRIRRYFEICGKVSNSQGSKRRLIIIEKPNKALNEKLTTRKCSQCRQQGHNSRTCKETYEVNTLWKNPHSENSREDRLNSFGDTVCERCNDAGVVSCVFCEQNFARNKDTNAFETTQVDTPGRLDSFKERQLKTTTYLANLGRLSKMTYRLDGKTKVEVCVKCSGTTLMVCPRCRGEPF